MVLSELKINFRYLKKDRNKVDFLAVLISVIQALPTNCMWKVMAFLCGGVYFLPEYLSTIFLTTSNVVMERQSVADLIKKLSNNVNISFEIQAPKWSEEVSWLTEENCYCTTQLLYSMSVLGPSAVVWLFFTKSVYFCLCVMLLGQLKARIITFVHHTGVRSAVCVHLLTQRCGEWRRLLPSRGVWPFTCETPLFFISLCQGMQCFEWFLQEGQLFLLATKQCL